MINRGWPLLLFLHQATTWAREITFPPLAPHQLGSFGESQAQQQYRSPATPDPDLLLEFEKFSGLSTFANLPWVHCLSPDDQVDKYDIAFLGAPFDTGTTGRPGSRFGPDGIRSYVLDPF